MSATADVLTKDSELARALSEGGQVPLSRMTATERAEMIRNNKCPSRGSLTCLLAESIRASGAPPAFSVASLTGTPHTSRAGSLAPTHRSTGSEPQSSARRRSSLLVNLEQRRAEFEGVESKEDLKRRMREQVLKRAQRAPADVFLDRLREIGQGMVGLAWRRYFDSEGNGELCFSDFCGALAAVKWEGDASSLWHHFGGCDKNTLSLEVLDAESALHLEVFGRWCDHVLGGPIEMFQAIDTDSSDSLTPVEFTDGLRELGFFDTDGLPPGIADEELVLKNLFPLLDSNGTGAVEPRQLLFLEKDRPKRARWATSLKKLREHGDTPQPAPSEASQLLTAALSVTSMSRKHWSESVEPGKSPLALEARRLSRRRSTGSTTPRFLREYRRSKLTCSSQPDLMSLPSSPGSRARTSCVASPMSMAPEPLPELPRRPPEKAALPALSRKALEKARVRKLYTSSLVSPLPGVAWYRPEPAKDFLRECKKVRARLKSPKQRHSFDPNCSTDFLTRRSTRGLFRHYGVDYPGIA